MLSSRAIIGLGVSLTLAVCALAVSLALSVPVSGLRFMADEQGRLALADTGSVVQALVIDGAAPVAVDGGLAIEEPDMFPTYADYNDFMAKQTRFAQALVGGQLALQATDGTVTPLAHDTRGITALPLMFWLQVLFGVGGMLTGVLVLAGRPQDRAAQLYALTGLGYLIFAPAAAVYSTRELLMDGDLFRALSIANHFGAMLFTASLSALLWSYPVRLGRFPMVTLIYAVTLASFLADTFQVTDTLAQYQLAVLAIYALSIGFAAMQWWKTRHAPAERAALRWFLLSIYLATGLFAGVIIIPAAIGATPPASQGVMFGAFLLMYWGLALGIVRYRLFSIAQWWRAIWWWFVGGLAVVVLDLVLVSMLAMSDALALSVSVAIVGWLYFPLRQWLWSRLGARRARTLAQWLPDVLPLLIGTQADGASEAQIRERWPALLAAVFRPLDTETADGALDQPAIADNGLALRVPDARDPQRHIVLRHPDGGERLFTTEDLQTLSALRELFDVAIDRLRDRDAGARVERERIRRDIHDDLGAKLLTLLHTSPADQQPLVREALGDLRTLLRALESGSMPLRDAVDAWQAEARKRVEAAGVTLQWHTGALDEERVLTARQFANLSRVVREGVSNALRHAQPSRLAIAVSEKDGQLAIEVSNDGDIAPVAQWPTGRGRQIMLGRVDELGGTLDWTLADGLCRLRAVVPVA